MEKYDIFISYRRDGGEFTAKMVRDRLTERGYRVFFDVETMRSGAFNTKLYNAIDACQDFLLILSPGALDRCADEEDWVRREVEYALSKGKNIVPILLRGFAFPAVLPESMEDLPDCNGLEANTQFFDAFLDKLQEFLHSKPAIGNRIRQSSLLKRMLPVLLSLLLLAVVGLGIFLAVDGWNTRYPRTAAEKDLTREMVYYVGRGLTYFEILADAKQNGLDAAQRYLQTGERKEWMDTLAISRNTLENTDLTTAAPSDRLLDALAESPFDSVEVQALYEDLLLFQKTALNDLAYIETLVAPEFYLSDSEKLQIIDTYEDYLDNELQYYAHAANQMLLPITDDAALVDFWINTLPELEHIPLRAASWGWDYDALTAAMEECLNNMENAIHAQETIVGNSTVAAGKAREEKIQYYESCGYTRAQAEAMVDLVLEGFTGDQAAYIVTLADLGYGQDAALAAFDYVSRGYTLERALVLVNYEILDKAAALIQLKKKYLELGADAAAADTYAAMELDLLDAQYQRRLEYCGLTTDDVETLWVKMLLLKDAMLYEDAVECLELAYELLKDSDENALTYLYSTQIFLSEIETSGIDYGVLVTAYGDTPHPQLQIGDIIVAFNGQPCRTNEDYVNAKTALTQKDYTVTVLRFDGSAHSELELALTTEMPLIGISSLALE